MEGGVFEFEGFEDFDEGGDFCEGGCEGLEVAWVSGLLSEAGCGALHVADFFE